MVHADVSVRIGIQLEGSSGAIPIDGRGNGAACFREWGGTVVGAVTKSGRRSGLFGDDIVYCCRTGGVGCGYSEGILAHG